MVPLVVVAGVLPIQLRWLRTLAALGRLEEARDEAAVFEAVGLPSGLGAKGTMLMVERVGIALRDLCETCPGRRGERGGFVEGGSRDSRRRFLSSCLTMRESSTVPVKGGWGELVATVACCGGFSTVVAVSTPTKKQMPQRNQVAGR